MRIRFFAWILLGVLTVLPAAAQENAWQGLADGPRLRAQFVGKARNLEHRLAVVQADVEGVLLADPTDPQYKMRDQGHIQFRLDQGPYILPLGNRIAFEGLTPGKHNIEVMLADNSYRPMGPKVELEITVP